MTTGSMRVSRRGFLKTAAAAAIPNLITTFSLTGRGAPAPSNRVQTGHIGFRGMGMGHLKSVLGNSATRLTALCDVDGNVLGEGRKAVEKAYGAGSSVFCTRDFRELLERPDVDAVFVATPDHWHALITIAACRAGKDVYCEKPESLTIREGRVMVEAARRYGRVVTGGSQRVWGDFNWYHRMVRGGALGDIREVFVNIGGPPEEAWLPAEPVPPELDWEMWVGPAPWRPFNRKYHPYSWRPYRDFSGGQMANWGAHCFGGALFACALHETGPVEITPPNGQDVPLLTYRFGNGIRLYHAPGKIKGQLVFKGTRGEADDALKSKVQAPKLDIPNYHAGGSMMGDFLHCIRTRQRPFRDIEVAHRTATVCHLGNIAYWLKRPLRWDPVVEQFVGDAEASRWLDRPRRAPWVLAV